MKISVRMEGGLGDHLLANRFIPAIKERWPSCEIDLYSDTEGNTFQSDILKRMWPSHFNKVAVLQDKKHKNFRIKSSNFPEEDYRGSIKNVPDSDLRSMTESYDKFYDLHIDSLEWMNYSFDWFKHFHIFPTPEKRGRMHYPSANFPKKFILAHLYARDDADSNMEDWYIERLVKSITQEFEMIVLYNDESKHKYEKLMSEENENLHFMNESVPSIFDIASRCTAMLAIDSGIRYIPHHYGKPVFTFSKYCTQYGVVQYSYLIRWLLNDRYVLPLHYDISSAGTMLKNCLKNPAYRLYPHLLDNIESLVAQRDITEYITE
jgi:ADP-heptose:LPS heptosyltransferase